MPGPNLSLTFALHYAPQPSILRGIGAFERSLKGSLVRAQEGMALPLRFKDQQGTHEIVIGAESFEITQSPFARIDRYTATVTSLAAQFLKDTPHLSPQEMELRVLLRIPVPDATRSLGGYAVASFAWPRKLELRPEALGKDHFLPTESGLVRLRLSVHQLNVGHELVLMMSNKHDRVNADPAVLEPAYALCLTGIQNIVTSLTSPAWQRVLTGLLGSPAQGK
ncbi:MAG: hypothetical protein HUU29_01510 [Planctomycetaceae bacterium]|nr:hypothetical protein [Planctomycetaceae bacterium]